MHSFRIQRQSSGYIDMLIDEIIPEIAKHELAQYIDVFCESGYFTVAETEQIIKRELNLAIPKFMSINSINGGVQSGVKYNALSVDHLEVMTTEDIEVLKNTRTMPVALPSCSYFEYTLHTCTKMIDEGLPLAL
jgi:imidazolonepropionase